MLKVRLSIILAVCVILASLLLLTSSAHKPEAVGFPQSLAQNIPPGTRLISIATKDLIVDPNTQTIYASVPGTAATGANSITKIDPVAGTIGNSVFVGSEPGKLAISDNSQFIYAALDGEGAFRRFDVTTQTAQLKVSLGTNPFYGSYYVEDLEVLPGSQNSVAVSRRVANTSPHNAGVAIFDGDVQRASAIDRSSQTFINQIEFSNSAATLYGLNTETSSAEFFKLAVNTAGVSIDTATNGLLAVGDFVFSGGRIYHASGRVIDPDSKTLLGTYQGMNFFQFSSARSVLVDSANDRVYFLTGGATEAGSGGYTKVYSFNKTTFELIASVDVFYTTGPVSSLVQYGTTGLAFRDDKTVYLINAPGSGPTPSPTPTISPSPTPSPTPVPTPGIGELRELSLVTRDLAWEVNTQTLYASTADSVTRIDPLAGVIASSTTVGSQADKLAVSDNGQYVYVGLDGENAVARFEVSSQSSNLKIPITSTPVDIEVMPGAPETFAVVRNRSVPEVLIFDRDIPRPLSREANVARLAFSNSPSVLYGYRPNISSFPFTRMIVDSCGLGVTNVVSQLFVGNVYDIGYDNGRLYSAGGRVIDPETGTLIGTFFVPSAGYAFVQTDSKADRIYSLTTDGTTAVLRVFDMQTFALIGALNLPGVTGVPTSFVRWGVDGLAFNTPTKVFFLRNSMIGGTSPTFTPAPTPSSLARFAVTGRVTDSFNPISNVTINYSGSKSGTTQTDNNGNFTIDNLSLCDVITITPSKTNYDITPSTLELSNPSIPQIPNFIGYHRAIGFPVTEVTVGEGDYVAFLPVVKSGGMPRRAADIHFTIGGGNASERSDYTPQYFHHMDTFIAQSPLKIPLSDDRFVEGDETFTVTIDPLPGFDLINPTITVTIVDNDTTPSSTNPTENDLFLVRQHYHDFLSRAPDTPGLIFWANQIASCDPDAQCREVRRINVSASFFVSIEFKETGYLVERLYKTAYGDAIGNSTYPNAHQLSVPIIRLNEFLADTQQISQGVIVGQGNWQQQLEMNKQSFIADFIQRSRFATAFPTSMTAAQFVDGLNTKAGNPLSPAERDQLVNDLATSTKTRAQVLRAIAEHQNLFASELNKAFVLMEYFGYLRRNPDDAPEATLDYSGYDFWLMKLNGAHGNYIEAEMVKAFLSSIEYRQRFGP